MKRNLFRDNIRRIRFIADPANRAYHFIRRMVPADGLEGQQHLGSAHQRILAVPHERRPGMVGFTQNRDFFTVDACYGRHKPYRDIAVQQSFSLFDMNFEKSSQLLRLSPRRLELLWIAARQAQRLR
ncbi:hypothetical protein D3C73_919160 [compost metagenome]